MLSVQFFADIAYAALALLIAVLAIYLTFRLLGKLAKFVVITVIVVIAAIVLWFIFSNNGGAAQLVPDFVKQAVTVFNFGT